MKNIYFKTDSVFLGDIRQWCFINIGSIGCEWNWLYSYHSNYRRQLVDIIGITFEKDADALAFMLIHNNVTEDISLDLVWFDDLA